MQKTATEPFIDARNAQLPGTFAILNTSSQFVSRAFTSRIVNVLTLIEDVIRMSTMSIVTFVRGSNNWTWLDVEKFKKHWESVIKIGRNFAFLEV